MTYPNLPVCFAFSNEQFLCVRLAEVDIDLAPASGSPVLVTHLRVTLSEVLGGGQDIRLEEMGNFFATPRIRLDISKTK